ncbi:MAG TPA: aminotransferase class I/II-fold pyridoxal phosphate-dependent enzyme, partial [Steroidobacteraceae bacterium]
MFERLDRVPNDPILGLMAAFRADSAPIKVDLGVGVFRDAKGDTPVLDCVRQAEKAVLARQTSKTYVAPAGNAAFNQAMEKLVFGADHPVFAAARIRSIQGPGGCFIVGISAKLKPGTGHQRNVVGPGRGADMEGGLTRGQAHQFGT